MKFARTAKSAATAALAGVTLMLAASSWGQSSPGTAGAAKPYSLKIADFPVMELAALYVGRDQGVFAKNGVTLSAVQISGAGAAMIPAVIAGSIDLAPSNLLSVMAAQQNGQDIKCFALITRQPATGRKLALLVPGGSTDAGAKDLAGKLVAVNALGGANDLIMRVWLESKGVDPTTVKFVPTAFPNMAQVLSNNTVAAVLADEPFTTQAIEQGAKVLDPRPYQPMAETPAFSCWATTSKQINENRPALTAFVASMNQANKLANDNREMITNALVNDMKFSASVAKAATVPLFDASMTVNDLAVWATAAKKYKMLKPDFNPATAVSPISGN